MYITQTAEYEAQPEDTPTKIHHNRHPGGRHVDSLTVLGMTKNRKILPD